jgi:hypothetical protein
MVVKKLISFSLFGEDPKYRLGVIKNLELIRRLMPDWEVIVFCGPEIPISVSNEIRLRGGLVQTISKTSSLGGLFWRFLPVTSFDFSHLIFRDADSRISKRELLLIDQWMYSQKTLHIIRDHPHHAFPMLGGLWGITNKIHEYRIPWEQMESFPHEFGADQIFLAQYVYPFLKKDSLIHDSYFFLETHSVRPQPHDGCGSFIGESFDAQDDPNVDKRNVVLKLKIMVIRRTLFGIARTLAMKRFMVRFPPRGLYKSS